jgi:DNA-binding transcriptional ArsR family regulator
VEALLGTLHPAVNWSPPVLEITHDRDEDIYPDGAGLVIMPSLFLFGRPTVFVDPHRPDAAPRLVYPVPMDAGISATLWEGRPRRGKALGALMGRTRAEILHALSEHCNTTELGRRVGISTAAASQHATVLRAAGLISSKRRLNTVEHSLTVLGSTLVEGIETDLVKSG